MNFYEELDAIVQEVWQQDKKKVKREALKVLFYFLGFSAVIILLYTY